ncbi:MAG: sigma factor [Bryobacteraceae bacterium]
MGSADNDPFKVYLREVQGPPLTKGEEIDLLRHVRERDSLADSAGVRLIQANLALVVSIAERPRDEGVPLLRLIQEGNLGLGSAVNTFAESGSDDFPAHAAACIEHAIVKAIATLR